MTENEKIADWFPLISLLVNLLIIAHFVAIFWIILA